MALPPLSKGRDAGLEAVTEDYPAGSVALLNKTPESFTLDVIEIADDSRYKAKRTE